MNNCSEDFNWFTPSTDWTFTSPPPVTERRFLINVSREGYTSKDEALACIKKDTARVLRKETMAFSERYLTISEFLACASLGHSFCHLYENDTAKLYPQGKLQIPASPVHKRGKNIGCLKFSMKTNQYFKGSQAIFIDVDETAAPSISDYVMALRYKPSCIYPSYSDGKNKNGSRSRRFHMVYIFDAILGKMDFLRISKCLTDMIVVDTREPMVDTCGERLSQYMNGCYGNPDTYNYDIFYSVAMFPPTAEDNIYYSLKNETDEPSVIFNEYMLNDMATLDYKTFTHSYSKRYGYTYRTELPVWQEYQGIQYQITDEDYLQLWHYPHKVVDGEKRRNKMAMRCCLRRLINPNITADELIYQLYIDRERYFDNSDGILDVETMRRKVEGALRLSDEELREACKSSLDYWNENRPRFIINRGVDNHQSSKRKIDRELNYQYIDTTYDSSITVCANAQKMPFSLSTLHRYRKDRGMVMNKTEKRKIFLENYNNTLSIEENIQLLKDKGLVVSRRTIYNYINMYIK